MTDLLAYTGLFLVSLAAATVLPMQSEAALIALLLADYSPWLLLVVASTGNILGSTINWVLGRTVDRYGSRRWFPASGPALDRAARWYRRYGRWSLLLSWVPVIGDPITVIAGMLRERLPVFLALVAVAKIGRYLVLIAVTLRFA
ncbi:MAG TPA: YqaA family protein [Reyranella sp.]|nr:YqaA family protein [Reyranella sp.]